jgi:hypothetical protein
MGCSDASSAKWPDGVEAKPALLSAAPAATLALAPAPAAGHAPPPAPAAPSATPAASFTSPLPAGPSPLTSFELVLDGDAALEFRYKAGAFAAAACGKDEGYSEWTAADLLMIDDLADGPITLCAVSRDIYGNEQPPSGASVFSWTKDTTMPSGE